MKMGSYQNIFGIFEVEKINRWKVDSTLIRQVCASCLVDSHTLHAHKYLYIIQNTMLFRSRYLVYICWGEIINNLLKVSISIIYFIKLK